MSVFTSLGILVLSVLIIASLKAVPGIFGLFYHYASGKYSAKKVSNLSIFFILGVETLPVIVFIVLNFILSALTFTKLDFSSNVFLMPMVGLFFALALAFYLFYFKKGYGTKLFISRKTAKNFNKRALAVKTRSDAFALGFTAGLPELIFTLPLYFILLIEVSACFVIPDTCSSILFLFVLLTISPLFFIYAYFRNGNNLANFERARIKNKGFFRCFISSLYAFIAVILMIFRILL